MNEEPDIVFARGGFSDVQDTLMQYSTRRLDGLFTCGWYGTAIQPERGSFCIVNANGDLANQIGNYLSVTYGGLSTALYCVETRQIPYDIAITRRAFLDLAPLWKPYLNVRVGQLLDGYDGSS